MYTGAHGKCRGNKIETQMHSSLQEACAKGPAARGWLVT